MTFNPDIHHRQSNRLREYDYSQAGGYFVTICTWQRESLFGEIVDAEMRLNNLGYLVCDAWTDLTRHYRHVALDAFVVMPNHVHGIIFISDVEARAGLKPAPTVKWHDLSEIVRGFKTFSSRRINESRNNQGCPVWQRNFYDRVLRNGDELTRARAYTINNPLKWERDKENPANSA
jgi:REP element-mobilizing transposase RayT